MPDFNFEVFKRQSKPRSSLPTVTLQKRGTFSINLHAFEALHKAEAVELLYDRQQKVIGIRPADTEAQHAYPLRKQSSGSTWLIAGNAFCENYNIPVGVARRYIAEPLGDDGTLIIDLKREATEITGPRGKSDPE